MREADRQAAAIARDTIYKARPPVFERAHSERHDEEARRKIQMAAAEASYEKRRKRMEKSDVINTEMKPSTINRAA